MQNQKLVEAISNLVHKKFIQSYDGKPHIRITMDKSWIEHHKTNQIDLAVLEYSELPLDWQKERKIGSQIALDNVIKAVQKKQPLDEKFIETTAEILHIKWLERNIYRASDIDKLSYSKLPEYQKEKDRFFVRAAIEIYLSKQKI